MTSDSSEDPPRNEDGWRRKEDTVRLRLEKPKTRFALSMLLGFVLLVVVVTWLPLGAMAGATFAAVGGFDAQIEELEGTEVAIYPTTGETAACIDTTDYDAVNDPQEDDMAMAMLQAEMAGATVPEGTDLSIRKDISLIGVLDVVPDAARISLTNEPIGGGDTQAITLGDVQFDASALQGEQLTLQDDVIFDDRHTDDQFGDRTPTRGATRSDTGEVVLSGQTAILRNADAQVHMLAFEEMHFPGLDMSIEFVDEADFQNDFSADGAFHENPDGYAHDGDYVHDNRAISQGETRTYEYNAMLSDADIRGHLRDQTYTADEDITDVHEFGTRYPDTAVNEGVEIEVEYGRDDIVTATVQDWTYGSESDFGGFTFDDFSGGNVAYETDTTRSSMGAASGRLYTTGNNEVGYGEFTVPDVDLSNTDGISFAVQGDSWSGSWGYPSVHIGGTEVWSETSTIGDWERISIDVSDMDTVEDIQFRFSTPDGTGVEDRSVWYDEIWIGDQPLGSYDASGDDELYWSTYEWAGGTGESSLRLLDTFSPRVADPGDGCELSEPALHPYIVDFDFGAPYPGQVDVEVEITNPGNDPESGEVTLQTSGGFDRDSWSGTVDPDDYVSTTLTWDIEDWRDIGPHNLQVVSDSGVDSPIYYTSRAGHLTTSIFIGGVGESGTIVLGDGDDGSCDNTCDMWAYVENPSRVTHWEETSITSGPGTTTSSGATLDPLDEGWNYLGEPFTANCGDMSGDETWTVETDSGDTYTQTYNIDEQTDKGDNCS